MKRESKVSENHQGGEENQPRGGSGWEKIRKGRDPKKVINILNLKAKYCYEQEKIARKEYLMERERLKQVYEEKGMGRKYRKILSRVSKQSRKDWATGMARINKKVMWSVTKLHADPVFQDGLAEWGKRVARGKGRERKRVRPKVKCYWGARVDPNEKDVLYLPPKTLTFPKVDQETTDLYPDVSKVKSRWDRSQNRDFNLQGEEVTSQDELSTQKSKEEFIEENRHRESYNPEKQRLNFSQMGPSDVKNNPRVILPRPRSVKEEVELTTRATLVTHEVHQYLNSLENQPDNLTKSERRGLKKLRKRIQDKEIVVLETDKSGSLCIMPLDMYMKLGEEHVKNDPKVIWEEVRSIQREIKGHLRALNLIFRSRKETQSEERVWEAKELKSTIIPVLSLLIKDHKQLNPDGSPKSHPVCGASSSINGELSKWISTILDAMAASVETSEVISSEEMLALVDELNSLLEEEGVPEEGLCVGSLDVKAL